MCTPIDPQVIMGDCVNKTATGVYLAITESVAPFAVGKYEGPSIEVLYKSEWNRKNILENYKKEIMKFLDEEDILENEYYNNNQNWKNANFHYQTLTL